MELIGMDIKVEIRVRWKYFRDVSTRVFESQCSDVKWCSLSQRYESELRALARRSAMAAIGGTDAGLIENEN